MNAIQYTAVSERLSDKTVRDNAERYYGYWVLGP